MVQQENWSFSEKTFRTIFENINSLRKNRVLCDVILKVESEEYYAHRVILSACSDYFCAMFTNEVIFWQKLFIPGKSSVNLAQKSII